MADRLRAPLARAVALFTWIYCAVAVLDPSDAVLGVKRIVFGILLSLFLALVAADRVTLSRDLLLRTLAIAVAFPAAGLAVFIARHQGQGIAAGLSLAKALSTVVLVLPLVAVGLDLRRPLFASLGLLAFGTIVLALGSIADPVVQEQCSGFLTANSVALIGSRQFQGLDLMMIFFVASPLLVLPVPFLVAALLDRSAAAATRIGAAAFLVLVLTAALLSASRALFAVLLLECAGCALAAVRRRPRLVAGVLLVAAACSIPAVHAIKRTSLFAPGERSNSIKIAHARSFLAHVVEHPAILLTGDGLGATFYSAAPGIEQEVYQTELTYLDLVRYFGIAGAGCFLLLLLAPFGRPSGPVLAGFAAYLIVAGSNPLLFNSTGMLAVVFYWSQQHLAARVRPGVPPAGAGR